MNLATVALRYKTVTLTLTAVMVIGGIISYRSLGKLEDPEYTIKTALIATNYPGADAREVEEEVTDKIEEAVQKLGQIKRIRSLSKEGASFVYVDIKDKYTSRDLPQIWDELRRKVTDVQSQLPSEAQASVVRDDYGDVYGVFYAITGDGYSYHELKDFVDFLKKELLLVKDVSRIEISGAQEEVVYVEFSRDVLSRLGMSPQAIYDTLKEQNKITMTGETTVGPDYVKIYPTGKFNSVEDIGDLAIRGRDSGSLIKLKDVANITRGYEEPPDKLVRLDGKSALGLGISTVSGGNVVEMGKAIKARLAELEPQIPVGIDLGIVSYQSDTVEQSVNDFIINLIEAIVIVIAVLIIFMGLSTGMLIGFVLLLTILATFIMMKIFAIDLQSISLGALIIALGMLVDNAIVVAEGVLVGIQTGQDKIKCAEDTVAKNSVALLGATIVAILAFAAIGLSQDSTGEYCRTLFYVVGLSLMLSWLLAVTVTPVLATMFLKAPENIDEDPYKGKFYHIYRLLLVYCLKFRWGVVILMICLLAVAVFGFRFIERSFFPASSTNKIMFDIWNPEGTYILKTSEDVKKLEEYLLQQPEIKQVSSFIGGGAQRFILNYNIEDNNSAYGQIIAEVKDDAPEENIKKTIAKTRTFVSDNLLNSMLRVKNFEKGSGNDSKIEIRFRGQNATILRDLADKAETIMRQQPRLENIRTDWRQKKLVYRPMVDEKNARRAGLSQPDISEALRQSYNGIQIGMYREGNRLLPILSRSIKSERSDIDSVNNVHIWSSPLNKSINLSQIVNGFDSDWENSIIRRRNRMRTITVQCDPVNINTNELLSKFKAQIDAIELPLGYSCEWGGEYESSHDAQQGLNRMLPITFILMMLIVLMLFNAFKQTFIIVLCLPLALIGVTAGLLIMNTPFSFMAMLGLLSLIGMMIKNAIVLIQEMDSQIADGKDCFQAIIDSGVSRFRPVLMAAMTTVLGMIPLVFDVLFQSMAVTIMFGLTFATALTLLVVPVLYSIFFKVPSPKSQG